MTFASLTIRSAVALATLSLASAPALAQGTAEQRSACTGDAMQYCTQDIPNVSAIEACLVRHEARLTPACRAEFHPTTKRTRLHRDHFTRR